MLEDVQQMVHLSKGSSRRDCRKVLRSQWGQPGDSPSISMATCALYRAIATGEPPLERTSLAINPRRVEAMPSRVASFLPGCGGGDLVVYGLVVFSIFKLDRSVTQPLRHKLNFGARVVVPWTTAGYY